MDNKKILLESLNKMGSFETAEQEFSQEQLESIYTAMDKAKATNGQAAEIKELKQLIKDILPFTKFDEAEEWIGPLLDKHNI